MITLTESAGKKVLGMMETEPNRKYLRVYVEGGGCSGLFYGMAFADEKRESDNSFESAGVPVLVDEKSQTASSRSAFACRTSIGPCSGFCSVFGPLITYCHVRRFPPCPFRALNRDASRSNTKSSIFPVAFAGVKTFPASKSEDFFAFLRFFFCGVFCSCAGISTSL